MSGYFKELVSFNVYKAQQGRRARRLSFIGFSLVFIFGAYALYSNYHTQNAGIAAVIIALLGIWISYRPINFPTFADFLVSVEAEMSKGSWPTRAERTGPALAGITSEKRKEIRVEPLECSGVS